jgi:hypothetical protein
MMGRAQTSVNAKGDGEKEERCGQAASVLLLLLFVIAI